MAKTILVTNSIFRSLYVTVSGKRVHSAQNVHSSYKRLYVEFNFVELLVNIHKGSMIP